MMADQTTRVEGGIQFRRVATIEPECDEDGKPLEFMPQQRFKNSQGYSLNKHGQGPFCKFNIRSSTRRHGLYLVIVNGTIKYVGECQDLAERFGPRGYGLISPRNCFEHGQPTNCKINHNILVAAQEKARTELWFCETPSLSQVARRAKEAALIAKLRPAWNGTF